MSEAGSEYVTYTTDSGCLAVRLQLRDKPEQQQPGQTGLLPYIGLAELAPPAALLRALAAEFLGTALLVVLGCGSCLGGDQQDAAVQIDDQAAITRISLGFGLTVAALAQTLGHVSGCHVNPAVSLGLVAGGKVGLVSGLLYIAAQCGGAVAGAALLAASAGEARGTAGLGGTAVSPQLSLGGAVLVEMLITAVLVMMVFAAAADNLNTASVRGSAPLAIGLTVTACHLFAVPLTGSSMNPARSLGPAAVSGNWDNHWVYWVGPLLGALLGALTYQLVFRVRPACPARVRRASKQLSPAYERAVPGEDSPSVEEAAGGSRGKELVWIEK